MAAFDNSSFNLVLPRFQGLLQLPEKCWFSSSSFPFQLYLEARLIIFATGFEFLIMPITLCHGPRGNFTGSNQKLPLDS